MADVVNFELLGERLRDVRKERKQTLEQVSRETAISVPTLSRVERGDAKGLMSETLVILSNWIGSSATFWRTPNAVENTPDVVHLHLRADKNLDRKTADALAHLFRAAYEQVKKKRS